MDAVIWSLVRLSPSVILASVRETSFCLIITTKSHDVLRKGNASKICTQNITTPINFYLGIKHKCPTAVFPQHNSTVTNLDSSAVFFYSLGKEQDPNTKHDMKGKSASRMKLSHPQTHEGYPLLS